MPPPVDRRRCRSTADPWPPSCPIEARQPEASLLRWRGSRARSAARDGALPEPDDEGLAGPHILSIMIEFHPYYIVVLLTYAVGLAIVYWLIRLAVRHAIADADKRRQGPRP